METNSVPLRMRRRPNQLSLSRQRRVSVSHEEHHAMPPRPPHVPGRITLPTVAGRHYAHAEGCLVVDGEMLPPRETPL